MAYNTPPTKTLSDSAPASDWNTYVRDDMTHFADVADHGSADHGALTLGGTGGLTYARFTDAAAPAAPGPGKTQIFAVSGKMNQRAGAAGGIEILEITTHTHTVSEKTTNKTQPADVDSTNNALSLDTMLVSGPHFSATAYSDQQRVSFTPVSGTSVAVTGTVVGVTYDGGAADGTSNTPELLTS